MTIEFTQAFGRHIDENHIGMAGLHLNRLDSAQPGGKRLRPDMIFGEARDMMIKRMQAGRGEHSRLAHAATQHLAPALAAFDQGFAAEQDGAHRRTQSL